jgi:hypothetical protein
MAQAQIKSQFFPHPIDGLNLVSPPTDGKPTEALKLDNYYIYDWGIRERGTLTHVDMPTGGDYARVMSSFASSTYPTGAWLIAGAANVYKYDGTTFTEITTVDAVNTVSGMFNFNKVIFMCDSFTNEIHSYTLSTDAYADTSFTGGPANPIHGFAFKNRCYILGNRNSNIYYGNVAAVSGALNGPYDVGQFFQLGNGLTWGCSWPYNQGVTNDELMVLGNDAGEVFIYSGNSPAEANWQLVARARIPSPYGRLSQTAGIQVPFIKLGQDILISTVRGVISLQKIFAGRKDDSDSDYYSVSNNLGYVINQASPDRSSVYPFAYFGGGTKDMYVLNYERGAWSKFPNVATTAIKSICVSAPAIDGAGSMGGSPGNSYVLIGDSNGGFWKLNEGATVADSAVQYNWQTVYSDFGSPNIKTSLRQKVIARDMASTSVQNGIGIFSDFDNVNFSVVDNQTTPVSSTDYEIQELRPAHSGSRWISYGWSKNGSASAMNEMAGFYGEVEISGIS